MSPIYLEAAVVVLGILLLGVEMLLDRGDKKIIAWVGILGPEHRAGDQFLREHDRTGRDCHGLPDVLQHGRAGHVFQRFALVTTIGVLVMAVDYLPVLRKFTPGATAQGGLGEFLALPVLTCAGLMWMASAVDFVMIFVSLELVTISFYILVSYTRRNAVSLEAGVKYLILGALSTGFFVYGITWVFGVTGQTNLEQVSTFLTGYQGSTAPCCSRSCCW